MIIFSRELFSAALSEAGKSESRPASVAAKSVPVSVISRIPNRDLGANPRMQQLNSACSGARQLVREGGPHAGLSGDLPCSYEHSSLTTSTTGPTPATASPGTGAYLQNYAHWFDEDRKPSTHAERFAAAAWRIAQIPVMAPAYVRRHGRVRTTFVDWDDRGNAAIRVDVAVSSAPEAVCLAYPWRRWTRDELGRWLEPESYNQPGAVTVLQVAMPLADMPLPEPRYELWAPDTAVAKQAVQVICGAVNIALTRVLAYDPLTEVDQ